MVNSGYRVPEVECCVLGGSGLSHLSGVDGDFGTGPTMALEQVSV